MDRKPGVNKIPEEVIDKRGLNEKDKTYLATLEVQDRGQHHHLEVTSNGEIPFDFDGNKEKAIIKAVIIDPEFLMKVQRSKSGASKGASRGE